MDTSSPSPTFNRQTFSFISVHLPSRRLAHSRLRWPMVITPLILGSDAFGYINKTTNSSGLTQIRLRFKLATTTTISPTSST